MMPDKNFRLIVLMKSHRTGLRRCMKFRAMARIDDVHVNLSAEGRVT
jgi:hypothetical protein